ncbi:MAG: substrate-binding domain-containing protein [Ardenticatenales bacterium]|nr:substrate-binding domain-containing protein [Ardenticatenales bacterium]
MKKWSLFIILILLLAACGGGDTAATTPEATTESESTVAEPTAAEPEVEAEEAEPTAEVVEEPEAVAEPTAEPTEEPVVEAEEQHIILATTTSTEDSGLLDYILPDFEAKTGIRVDVVAVGTGQALALGESGDADVLLVHARAREDAFMDAGHGVRREDVMYNDFVIVGPPDDPAGIRGKNRVARALEDILNSESLFVSRGDDSGTHTKEQALWAEAGLEPAGDWYISAGQGMGAVLAMADELQAYTMSDRATYLAQTLAGTSLEIMVEGDPILFNPYGVMAVNPDKGDHIQIDLANQFIDWLISVETQELISQFGIEEFGSPLFTPDSGPWRVANGIAAGEESEAEGPVALTVTGMVQNELGWTEAELLAMETMEAEAPNSNGELETYTGVSVNSLLALAEVKNQATTVTFITDTGETLEMSLADLTACENCILSFRTQGGLSTAFPGFDDLPRLRGVVQIVVS